ASITDATPEFTLSGDGRGDVTLNPGEAPAPIGNDGRTFRYWVHGDFADGPLDVNFIPGSWGYTFALTSAASSQSISSSTTDLSFIDVMFPTHAGYTLDQSTILDAAPEFSINSSYLANTMPSGANPVVKVSLVDGIAPALQSDGSWHYAILLSADSGVDLNGNPNVITSTSFTLSRPAFSITLDPTAWSYTHDGDQPTTTTQTVSAADNSRSYIDLAFAPTTNGTLTTPAPATSLSLSGTGVTGTNNQALVTVDTSQAPTALGGGVWRYYLTGNFGVGSVQVQVAANAVTDSNHYSN